jgi:hypothetical protein
LHDALGAPDHLLRRAPRERQQQDAPWIGAIEHELGDAVRERRRLAGPGARDHEQRLVARVQDCLALLVI